MEKENAVLRDRCSVLEVSSSSGSSSSSSRIVLSVVYACHTLGVGKKEKEKWRRRIRC